MGSCGKLCGGSIPQPYRNIDVKSQPPTGHRTLIKVCCGGGWWWWLRVILVLSFGLSQAEQYNPFVGNLTNLMCMPFEMNIESIICSSFPLPI